MLETARVQYVFLDVVGFTSNRSVEAQSEVVATLNDVVTKALQAMAVPSERTVLLPTGDGIAIALIDVSGIDVHLRLALEILRLIAAHNSITSDAMRQFEIRIAINENIDNVLPDINGRRNVAGAGISMAQRIMDKADASQVLVGHAVYDVLRQRQRYFSSFRAFTATGKHGVTFSVYQYLSKDAPGLSVTVPSAFAAKKVEPAKLTKFAAYYMAHAVANRAFLLSRKSDPARDYVATVLLNFLAEDSVAASETGPHEEATKCTWHASVASFEEQYHYYYGLDFWSLVRLADLLRTRYLQPYREHFETANYMTSYAFVKHSGVHNVQAEWPQIANEFGLGLGREEQRTKGKGSDRGTQRP